MQTIIDSNNQLRSFLPNSLRDCDGEIPLIEKLSGYLDSAQLWVVEEIIGEQTFEDIANGTSAELLRLRTQRLIALIAICDALPSLDLVLTPNGFGIVSSSAIAPASKDRVSALADKLAQARDLAADRLLISLRGVQSWMDSKQCEVLSDCLLQLPSEFRLPACSWSDFCEARNNVRQIENYLAANVFSIDLVECLRAEKVTGTLRGQRFWLAKDILSFALQNCGLPAKSLNYYSISTLVERVKRYPLDFPEWHDSEISSLYKPRPSVNDNSKGGYWL